MYNNASIFWVHGGAVRQVAPDEQIDLLLDLGRWIFRKGFVQENTK